MSVIIRYYTRTTSPNEHKKSPGCYLGDLPIVVPGLPLMEDVGVCLCFLLVIEDVQILACFLEKPDETV